MTEFFRMGRMMSGSKSHYDSQRPTHVVVYNANICSKSRGKFWFGDLDVTADIEDLKRLAAAEGEEIFVLREMDARFQTEAAPRFENAVARITPDGAVSIDPKAIPRAARSAPAGSPDPSA